MNLPNKLTVLRIILTPIFMLTLVWEFPFHYLVSLLIFIAASITDLLDGKIARSRGLVTDFGKFLDPLADKMLTTAAFLGFIALGIGHGAVWIAFIVLFREFMVSSIRLIASTSGGKVIAANIWGKLKTVFQMTAIIFALTAKQFTEILALVGVREDMVAVFSTVLGIATSVLLWISAVLCVISGVIYLLDNKDFVSQTK
ncbi:MAG: CDP-diacylglycerol--glycerol-3-phosphate 3-phosphatidyltransferase [Clostridia bacterium]|nr:CDP-diacylglycerol--glycerol-3-phosphate 3-phosphatidyltransferase [Clostridia bacterium]